MDPEEKEKMDKHFGAACWENGDFVVRARLMCSGELRIIVNRKIKGREVVAYAHVPGMTVLVIER